MTDSIGFIGLGHLGLPLAANLLSAGHALRVYNRTARKADPLVAQGAHSVARPADAVAPGGIVVTIVWDDAALDDVVRSEGFLNRLGTDGVHLSMSTVSPHTAQRLAALHAEHGSAYVAAPVFGRPEAVAARHLWIPLSGPQAAKERVRPLLRDMGGQGIFDFGEDVGAATVVKLAGNFLIVSAGYALGEALAMAQHNGVDPTALVDMLTHTLFPAPIYQSYGARMAQGAAPFGQSAIPRKDVGLFRDIAHRRDVPTPMSDHLAMLLTPAERRA